LGKIDIAILILREASSVFRSSDRINIMDKAEILMEIKVSIEIGLKLKSNQ